MNVSLGEAAELMSDARTIVITAHVHPDGDAIGSSLGLMHFLRGQGKEVQVLIDDDIPAIFDILPGYELIEKPDPERRQSADLLIALDVSLDRIGRVREMVQAPILNIDHHITNDGALADKLYLDGNCAATAEIIYRLIRQKKKPFSQKTAMCLYTGLATDTGWFRFSNTTPSVMQAAAELLQCGVRPHVISEALERKPFAQVKGLAAAMGRIELFHEGRAAGAFLTAADLQSMESPDGLIDMIRVIDGTELAVVMKEKEPDICRVSMRSKGLDVTKIAVRFGGGGHVRAAGCTISQPFETAKKALIEAIDAALEEQEGKERSIFAK